MKLSEELRQRRKELNITQQELSRKTNISSTQISKFENDKDVPTEEELNKISKALKKDFARKYEKDISSSYVEVATRVVSKTRKFNLSTIFNILIVVILLGLLIVSLLPLFTCKYYDSTNVIDNKPILYTYTISLINLNVLSKNIFYSIISYSFIVINVVNILFSIIISFIKNKKKKKAYTICLVINYLLFIINIVMFILLFINGSNYLKVLNDSSNINTIYLK